MEKRIPVIIALLLFLASFSLLANRTDKYFAPLSPQATVDPDSVEEEFNPSENVAIYDNEGLFIPSIVDQYIARKPAQLNVLGARSEEKRIEVDLTNQRLYAFEGDEKVFDYVVSTGKWGRTPTGVFKIWIKLRAAKMEGGSQELGTYYYLPNVPYVMYFANDEIPAWRGFGIHGTYWHDNFGTPMSHGCINMRTEEVEQLYYWATPDLGDYPSIKATQENQGTTVVIYGTAPGS